MAATLLITAVAYTQALSGEFVYDDLGQIVYNPGIKSWDHAIGYFASHVWANTGGVALYYRPAFMLWLAANYALFGLQPAYWHLAAVALHLLACALLYFLGYRLAEDRWTALVAVLLFGLHPAHVEAVAWISGATEPMLASLLFGSLLCHLKHRQPGNTGADRWRAASLFLAFLGLLAKETAIVMPALIFSYDWILGPPAASRRQKLRRAAQAAGPYLLISIAVLVMRGLALKHLTPPHTNAGLAPVLLAWPEIVAFYAAHMLVPWRLSAFYKLMTVARPGLWNFLVPGIVISAGAAALYYGSRRSKVFGFLSAWCAIMLVPMLNVTLLYNVENVHDRYLYLPSAAFCLMLAGLLARLKEWSAIRAWAFLFVIAAGYAFITVQESRHWKNDVTLAQHGLDVSADHPIAPQVLGNAYMRQDRVPEAIPYLLDALKAQPGNVDTLCSLGLAYFEIDALPLAEECLTKAAAINPLASKAHLFLGILRYRQKRLDEAEAEIRRGIELEPIPDHILFAHYHLGNVLYAKGDRKGALREYRLEGRNDPSIDRLAAASQNRAHQIERELQQYFPR